MNKKTEVIDSKTIRLEIPARRIIRAGKDIDDRFKTPGLGDSQKIFRYTVGEWNVKFIVETCTYGNGDEFLRVLDSEGDPIDSGNHVIVKVLQTAVGVGELFVVQDKRGMVNIIGADGKFMFERWIDFPYFRLNGGGNFAIVSDLSHGGTRYNVIYIPSMTLLFREWGDEIAFYFCFKNMLSASVITMKKSDVIPSAGSIFMKRSDGKIDALSIHRSRPFILTEGIDNVIIDDNGFMYAECRGKRFTFGYPGNSIECSYILGTKRDAGTFFAMLPNGKWTIINSASGDFAIEMTQYNDTYDKIYDRDSRFPIVEKNGKYNYVDLLDVRFGGSDENMLRTLSDKVGTEWFEDADDAERTPNEYLFRVKLDGKWREYTTKNI